MSAAPVHVEDQGSKEDTTLAVQLFASMLTATPERSHRVVRDLAGKGNLTLLRVLLDSGLLDADFSYAPQMACAIAPLVGPGAQEQERIDLVSSWLKAIGLDTPEKLGARLPELLATSEIGEMLKVLGADPLAIVKREHPRSLGSFTALGDAVHSLEREKVMQICELLIQQGRDPVACRRGDATVSMFEAMAEDELNDRNSQPMRTIFWQVLEALRGRDLPAAWEYQAGLGLMRYLTATKPISHNAERAMIGMLGIARFDAPANWVEIMRSGDSSGQVAGTLLDEKLEEHAIRVVANMSRDGVNLDELWAVSGDVYGGKTRRQTMPLLHAAAALDRPKLVEALLEAGSDPGPATHVLSMFAQNDWTEIKRDALQVAKPGSASEKLIMIWKARRSIGSVLDKTGPGRAQA